MSSAIVQKLRNYCNVLRDDGMSYLSSGQAGGDYPSMEFKAGVEHLLRYPSWTVREKVSDDE